MDYVDDRYELIMADMGREIWVRCKACPFDIVKAYPSMGFSAEISSVNRAIVKHEKKFHTERRTFLVYPISALERYQANWLIELKVHSVESCSGQFCVIHNPSMHHMRFWPIAFDPGHSFLALRSCQHQMLHPDPDSLAYVEKASKEKLDHECCPETCCIEED